jgi:hypothetical protein
MIELLPICLGLVGEPRRVLAVEKGPAEVVVRDPAAQRSLDRLAGAFLDREIINARRHTPVAPVAPGFGLKGTVNLALPGRACAGIDD